MTENDLQVFEFIKAYIAKNGTPPSTRDIATGLDIPAPTLSSGARLPCKRLATSVLFPVLLVALLC